MALNIFKKRKPEEKPAEAEKKKEQKAVPAREKKTADISGKKGRAKAGSYWILKTPHVTEKAGDLAEKGQYVFRVFNKANKTEIKKTIENNYAVDVVSVKIIKVSEKKRRLGRIKGVRPGYKKAIVKLRKGQKIEVLPR